MSTKNEKSSTVSLPSKTAARTYVMATILIGAVAGIAFLIMSFMPKGDMLPKSRDIFTLYDTYNMTLVVVFDEESPIVGFIAPDGSQVDMESIRYRAGSNFIQFFLPNAMPGTWRMDYDPLSNTEISSHYSVYMDHIFIKDFDVLMPSDDSAIISVSFEVSADEPGEFNFELYAVFTSYDNSIVDEVMLERGYGMLNEAISTNVDFGSVQEMGGFMLRLTAHVRHGQASIQDTVWADLRHMLGSD